MFFYVMIIAAATFFASLANYEKSKNKVATIAFYSISAVLLFIPLAMRDCGVDFDEYYKTYLSIANRSWSNYWSEYNGRPEPLYAVLNYVADKLFGSFQGVLFLCAVLSICFTYFGLYKFKDQINLGIAVWSFGFTYYLMMYGLNRMMIAVAIVTWSYHYWLENNTKQYFFWIVVAGLFHYSAFLMIPFYYLVMWIDKKDIVLRSINWARVAIVVIIIFVLIYQVVPRLFGHYPWFIRYEQYFSLSITLEALNNNLKTFPTIVFAVVFNKKIESYLQDKKMLQMLYIYVALMIVSVIMPVHRLCYYFYPCIILLNGIIPHVCLSYYNNREAALKNYIVFMLLLIVVGLFAIWLITCYGIHWAPYLNPYRMGHF